MAAKPPTNEAVLLTEKKMDMTLDEIIKMSKSNTARAKKQRISNRSKPFINNAAKEKSAKLRQFMNSRSSLRQGALAQRRSNLQGNQFRLATEAAQKAAVAPMLNRPFNRSSAVNMKKQRVGGPPVQRKAARGGFAMKQSEAKVVLTHGPQTLDSLFANMKEQRMMVFSQVNNGGRRNAGSWKGQQWGRGGRFSN